MRKIGSVKRGSRGTENKVENSRAASRRGRNSNDPTMIKI
jgi:hypothetical protein